MKNKSKNGFLLLGFLCLAGFLFCYFSAFHSFLILKLYGSTVSLRYDSPFSASEVCTAMDYAQSESNVSGAVPSFWREDTVQSAIGGSAAQDVAAIYFYGNANACLGANYLVGTAPHNGTQNSCAVSEALAWKLWRSTDILGQSILVKEESSGESTPYSVCGIFAGEADTLLCTAGADGAFLNIDLEDINSDNPVDAISMFCQGAKLGTPSHIVFGPQLVWLISLLLSIPIVVLVAKLLFLAISSAKHLFALPSTALLLILLCVGACFLPTLLHHTPGWLIPGQWGNAEAWNTVVSSLKDFVGECFAAAPTERDVQAKWLFFRYAFSLVVACCLEQPAEHFFSLAYDGSVPLDQNSKTEAQIEEREIWYADP